MGRLSRSSPVDAVVCQFKILPYNHNRKVSGIVRDTLYSYVHCGALNERKYSGSYEFDTNDERNIMM